MIPLRENGDSNGHSVPQNWERAYDAKSNRYFYVDHNKKTTTWLNPMDKWKKPKNFSECIGDQLPFGWEKISDPIVGLYYTNHIERRNQRSNPVSDWQRSLYNQHHYTNSHHMPCLEQSGNSLDSNNQTISPLTASKPDASLQAFDIEKSATSLNNSTTLDTEIIDTIRSNTSTRGSRCETRLLDIMDNRFGRQSSQGVEV